MGWIVWVTFIALHAVVAVFASRRLGPVFGVGVSAVLVTVEVLLAGALLRWSKPDQITWRNRAAGLLLYWGRWVGGGSLTSLLVKNALAGLVFCSLSILVDQVFSPSVDVEPSTSEAVNESGAWKSQVLLWVTFACWCVLMGGWALMLRAWHNSSSRGLVELLSRRERWLPAVLPVALTIASIAFRYSGYDASALVIVAVPIAVVLSPIALLLLVLFTYWLRGKPFRWN